VTARRAAGTGTGNTLRLSVTGRCNLRCSYCRPGIDEAGGCAAGRAPAGEATPGLDGLLRMAALVIESCDVVKIRLTGGEPLIRPDIDVIARRLGELTGVAHVGVTTNGQLLERWARPLREAGVDSVNVSLDSLRPDRYRAITGGGSLRRVTAGLAAAREAGMGKVKTNFVVMGGVNDDEMETALEAALEEGFELRFLELMSFAGSAEQYATQFVSGERILERLSRSFDLRPLEGRSEQTARMFAVRGGGREGVVGIIASSDGRMCLACNRIRITADGRLRRCLKDPFELDLAGMLREGMPRASIVERLEDYLRTKSRPAPLAGAGSMLRIGG
jgi:cyclic pyranopterin phosphate synthase